jgi:drug/metabolite transporter (DMT)-like permease
MSPIKRFLLMMALTAMWSPSFLFIKLAVEDIPPMVAVSLRLSIAAVIMGLILLFKGYSFPRERGFWLRATVMAIFSSSIPFAMFCYAEQWIESSMAAILNGTNPMFTAILAQIFVASDRLNMQKIVGITLSMAGMVLLFLPQLQSGVDSTVIGMAAVVFASFCYAVGHVYGKLYTTGQKPFVTPAAQFIVSSLLLWPFAIWNGDVARMTMPSASAIFGVCGMAILGTVFAFIIYYKLLETSGPTAISTVACFFPVMGMLLGFIFLGESFTLMGLVAAGIILLGMLTVNEVIVLKPTRETETTKA